MPTAVEHVLLEFLKLDIASNQDQRELVPAVRNLDSDFLKLSNASADDFLKIEQKIAPDIWKIGGAQFETGEDFTRLANFAGALDAFLIKLNTGPTVAPAAAVTGDGSVDLQRDFLKLDGALRDSGQDLKIFGADFLKLSQSQNFEAFTVKLHAASDDALKVSTAFSHDLDDFQTLADDFIKLNANPESLDHKLGVALANVADDFQLLMDDYLKIDVALRGRQVGTASQLEVASAVAALTPGSTFGQANTDYIKLSHDLSALAGPAAAGIDAILKNAFGGGGGTAFQ